ncbi:MAG: hypothetical protein ACXWSC_21810, partial [Bdellovibrionota bacterium]
MNDLHFASPIYLYLLLLLPALHLIFSRFDKNARGKLLKFLAEENLRQLLQDRGTIRDRGKRLSFWLGLALLILALARPQANP